MAKDLEFVETEELVGELEKRYDNMVFMASRKQGNNEISYRKVAGQMTYCLGLCELLKQKCLAALGSWTSATFPSWISS